MPISGWPLLVLGGVWIAVAIGLLVPAWDEFRRRGEPGPGRTDESVP